MASFSSRGLKLFSTEDAKYPCVRIQNLKSAAGQTLNGKIGRNKTVSHGGQTLSDENTARQKIKIPGIAGIKLIKKAYLEAKKNDYRFLSYGDAMIIV